VVAAYRGPDMRRNSMDANRHVIDEHDTWVRTVCAALGEAEVGAASDRAGSFRPRTGLLMPWGTDGMTAARTLRTRWRWHPPRVIASSTPRGTAHPEQGPSKCAVEASWADSEITPFGGGRSETGLPTERTKMLCLSPRDRCGRRPPRMPS
jgi:hypothetical protein